MPTDACKWTLADDPDCDAWDTDCGQLFVLNEGGPTENLMRFCCYCGKPLVEVKREVEEDRDAS